MYHGAKSVRDVAVIGASQLIILQGVGVSVDKVRWELADRCMLLAQCSIADVQSIGAVPAEKATRAWQLLWRLFVTAHDVAPGLDHPVAELPR